MRRARSLLLLLALAGCAESGSPDSTGRPNVLLVTVDTLRADHVGCYGYERDVTPHLDALAAEGVRFERAYSHAPFTAPSHASLLTSLHTPSHGVLAWAEELAPEAVTLPDRFGALGYRTAAFYNNPGLAASKMTRGFEHEERFYFETAGKTVEAFFAWLDGGRAAAFCAWVHLWDVHRPYAWRDWRPQWLVEKIGQREPGFMAYGEELFGKPTSVAVGRDEGHYNLNPAKRANPQEVAGERRLLDGRDFAYITNRYDAGVLFADRGLGRLFDGLRERGLYENTILVVTADHGESLTERGACYFTHDPFLYEETLRVPLVIRFPEGRHAGTVVERLARGVDVLPTLYEAAGVEPTGAEQGRSLIGRIEGRDAEEYLLFAQTQTRSAKERRAQAQGDEWLEHRAALSDGRHKLIHDRNTGSFAYFELESDPGEQLDRNADPASAAQVERLRAALQALEAGLPRAAGPTRKLDEETERMLAEMGYGGE